MEVEGLTCNGCGSTDIEFDPKIRKVHCNQCGREEFYSRARLGATGKVAFAKDNAIRFFNSGDFATARQFANDVLNMMQDNSAALFMVAYIREFYDGDAGIMKEFFRDVETVALEYDEVRDLLGLFEGKLYNMRDFELEMLTVIIKNMQSKDDKEQLESFIETVCPTCIKHFASADFLNETRIELYTDIVSHCRVPRTCLELIRAIRENPDSPYKSNTFAMQNKTQYFLAHFVEPVGGIIAAMAPIAEKPKFLLAYQQTLDDYRKRAAQATYERA